MRFVRIEFEPSFGAPSGDLDLGEGRHVLKADVLVHVAAFGADEGEIVGAPKTPFFARPLAGLRRRMVLVQEHVGLREVGVAEAVVEGREEIRPLPAIGRAEHRAERLHPVVTRRLPQRPRGDALLVGIVNGEDLGIGLLVLLDEIARLRISAEAPRIDSQHVDGRLPVDHPFRELPACAAGGGDAERMALVEPEIPEARRRADDRRAVRRVGDGAVVDFLHPNLAEGGHAGDRGFDMRGEAIQVLGEELVFADCRRPLDIAGRRSDLVGPEQQAARLLAHVPGGVRLA